MYLNAIAEGDTSDLPTPKTREEKFLHAIATEDTSDLPTPITREEVYLRVIAENSGSSTLIPKTITKNGTYNASDDEADGYSSVSVNVTTESVPDWTELGYDDTSYISMSNTFNTDFEYAKDIKNNWNPGTTDLNQKYMNNTDLVYFPNVDFSNAMYLSNIFNGCINLTTVPPLDLPSGIRCGAMFYGCTSLKKVLGIKFGDNILTAGQLFQGCTNLEIIRGLDFGDLSDNTGTLISGCSKLTTIEFIKIRYLHNECLKGADKLTKLIIHNADSVPSTYKGRCNDSIFGNIYTNASSCTIYVPQSMISTYQNHSVWGNLYAMNNNIFQPIEGSEFEL